MLLLMAASTFAVERYQSSQWFYLYRSASVPVGMCLNYAVFD